MAKPLRIGVVGLGNIGREHARLLQSGAITGAVLAAVSSPQDDATLGVPHFSEHQDLMASGLVDAVLVATPTHSHVAVGLAACEAGLHLLMEKPIAMSVQQASELIAARRANQQVAVMLNQRFHPHYAKIKAILDDNLLGKLTRVSWTMTAWYRPDVYYQVSRWRGTWPGEGGGLLINQCIHNLDVLQWLAGMPRQIIALVGFGKYHAIEVEDEVSALLSFDEGLTGTLVASSGEAPGINQLDLIGDRGMLRYDSNGLSLSTSDGSVSEHCATTRDMFGVPAFEQQDLVVEEQVNQHASVIQNFVAAVRGEAELATPVEEGLASIELANAICLSAWQNSSVQLPIDTAVYERELQQRIQNSQLREPADIKANIDMGSSYR